MAWTHGFFDPLKLYLDTDNPRVAINEESEQQEIRKSLLQTERVLELAREIVDVNGLLMGERIIVAKENGKDVVLEGNRRVAACQMLLDRKRIPNGFKGKFPILDKEEHQELIQALSAVPADIAPSRDAAEITITRRHTKTGVLPWLPLAQHRRIQRLIKSGKTKEKVAEIFGISKADLARLLRGSELMRLVNSQKGWSRYEQEALSDPRLKINPFTRFFTLKGVKETLGVEFEKDGTLKIVGDKRIVNKATKEIARALLIPDPDTGKPRFNTRATPLEVFESAFSNDDVLSDLLPKARRATTKKKSVGNTKRKQKKRNRRPVFFEDLESSTGDDILDGVVGELREINYKLFPRAAAVLARSTLECSLIWAISMASMEKELRKEYKTRDPGLEKIIKFCIRRHDDIFCQNVKRVLEQWLSTHKDYCDLIVHGRFLVANENSLEHLAKETRPFLQRLFDRELFKGETA